MNKLPVFLLLLFFFQANSQYYYKDIVAAADITRQMKTYVANNVKKVTAAGVSAEGTPVTDFSETHEVLGNGTILKITTRNIQVISSVRYTFNAAGQLINVVDSSEGIRSVSNYTYNADGKITSISNTTTDADSSGLFSQTEVHNYSYKDGKLDLMWRIINKTDSAEVRFLTDKDGNVIQELNVKRGAFSDPIDYYYDDRNRLTDIVRFNHKADRPLPDFMFEYDDNNRVIQKITVVSSSKLGYLIWRYLYNEKGLKTKEAMYNKDKERRGTINYTYN